MKREMIEIGKKVRIENGPLRVVKKATDAILTNGTLSKRYKEGGVDAMGKKIVLLEDATFLDDFNPWGWYIYTREGVVEKSFFGLKKKEIFSEDWKEYKICSSKEEALEVANGIS